MEFFSSFQEGGLGEFYWVNLSQRCVLFFVGVVFCGKIAFGFLILVSKIQGPVEWGVFDYHLESTVPSFLHLYFHVS